MTPPASAPTVRYHVILKYATGPQPVVLESEKVIAWVEGFAAALGEGDVLAAAIQPGPEDTRRVQALQIGDARGWFEYLYPEYPPASQS